MENNTELTFSDVILKIKEIGHFLLPKWKSIVFVGLIGAILGVFKSIYDDNIYKAELKFILQEDSEKSGGISNLASSFGFGSTSGDIFNTPNMLEFLKTRSLIEAALLKKIPINSKKEYTYAQFYIEKNRWIENSKLKKIKFELNKERRDFSRVQDSVLGLIFTNLIKTEYSVSQPDDKNGIILMELKTKNEQFSKFFLEELISLVSDYYIETKTKKQKQSVEVLERQVDSVRNELYSSIAGVALANDQVFGLNPAMNVKRVPSAKKQVDVQANSAILNELVKNLELSKMNLMNQTPLIEVIDKPVYPLEVKRLGKLKAIIIGGFLGGMIIVLLLLMRRYLASIKEKGDLNK